MRRLGALLVLAAGVSTAVAAQGGAQPGGYVPERVYDSSRKEFTDFEAMLAALARADVVFLGEQHDSAPTHRLQLAALQGLARRRGDIVLSLEMFERDVQMPLGHFLSGHLPEPEFLKEARPWPRYATDYKPLVDFAKARKWPVVAANVPRSIATEVARGGLAILDAKSADEKTWFAADLKCPTDDEYFERFGAAMGGHPADSGAGSVAAQRQMVERFYFAQCLKDETMGESIARAYAAAAEQGARPLVVHVNGAFHSDFGTGTAERARRRLPGKRIAVVSMLPVENLDTLAPGKEDRKRADYLVYTLR